MLIILFLVASIPITFIYVFFKDFFILTSLFSNYINSGNSFFLPFLSYNNILFQFTTGHLIDIIIIINIIGFFERIGYHYYVKVCLKNNYFEMYSDPYTLETKETQEETFLNSSLILGLGDDSGTINDESFVEFNYYWKRKIDNTQFSTKSRFYSSIKMKLNNLNCLHNSSNNNNHYKNNFPIFQQLLTNVLINYHLPSKNHSNFADSNKTGGGNLVKKSQLITDFITILQISKIISSLNYKKR